MTPKEKALDFYDKFHVYNWDEVNGYMTDDKGTKEMCNKVIDEIIELWSSINFDSKHSFYDFWKEVKQEIIKL